MAFLKEKGVGTGVHYTPSHRFAYFEHARRSRLTVTESIENKIVTIPLYYEMTDSDVELVIQSILEFDRKG